jgi:hypothetical protein
MHWQQGGEIKVKTFALLPRTYPKSQGGACAFVVHFWLLECAVEENRLDRFWLLSMHKSRGCVFWLLESCICAGGALVCFGGLCSLLEHGFVSDVSSHCPCLRGPRLVFFK